VTRNNPRWGGQPQAAVVGSVSAEQSNIAAAGDDEKIDTLQWVAPCLEAGCNRAHTGFHDINWFVSRVAGNAGTAFIVKGHDARCWERFEWDSLSIKINFDNCWWATGYQYSRYSDGTWLMRWWKPGESVTVDHTVYGGRWDSCTDTPVGANEKRTMKFLWRDKAKDWGPAGKLDTINIQQSYPHEPRVRENYVYARGHGLIGWSIEDDRNPAENKGGSFNLPSTKNLKPAGTACVNVDLPAENSPTLPSTPAPTVTPSPTCTGDVSPGLFTRDSPVSSCDGRFLLVFQSDGNLVLYPSGSDRALWSSNTGNKNATSAQFQNDGNLVVYSGTTPLWNSMTGGNPGAVLVLQNDGNLVISLQQRVLWSSGTGGR
jgi:hypothetical protein